MRTPTPKTQIGWPKLPSMMSIGALAALSLACGGGGAGEALTRKIDLSSLEIDSAQVESALTNLPAGIIPQALLGLQTTPSSQKANFHPRSKASDDEVTPTDSEESSDTSGDAGIDDGLRSGAYEELQSMLDRISIHRGELAIQYVLLDQVLPQIREICGEAMSCEIPEGTFSIELTSDIVAAIVELAQGDDVVALEPGETEDLPRIRYERLDAGSDYHERVELSLNEEESLSVSWSEDKQLLKMVDAFSDEGYTGVVTYINDTKSGTFSLTQDVDDGTQRHIENILIKEKDGLTTFESSQQAEGIESYQVTSSGNLSQGEGEMISSFAWKEYPLLVSGNISDPFYLSDMVGDEEYITGYHDGVEGWYWGDPARIDQVQLFLEESEDDLPLDVEAGSFSLGELTTTVEQVRERFSGQGDVLEVAFREGTDGAWTVDNPEAFEEVWEPEELFMGAQLSDSSFLDVNNLAIIVPQGSQVIAETVWDQAIGIAFALPAMDEGAAPEVFVNVWGDDLILQTAQVYLMGFSGDQVSLSLMEDVFITPSQTGNDDYWEYDEEDFSDDAEGWDEEDDFSDDFEGMDDFDDLDSWEDDDSFGEEEDMDGADGEDEYVDFDDLEDFEGWEDIDDLDGAELDEFEELDDHDESDSDESDSEEGDEEDSDESDSDEGEEEDSDESDSEEGDEEESDESESDDGDEEESDESDSDEGDEEDSDESESDEGEEEESDESDSDEGDEEDSDESDSDEGEEEESDESESDEGEEEDSDESESDEGEEEESDESESDEGEEEESDESESDEGDEEESDESDSDESDSDEGDEEDSDESESEEGEEEESDVSEEENDNTETSSQN